MGLAAWRVFKSPVSPVLLSVFLTVEPSLDYRTIALKELWSNKSFAGFAARRAIKSDRGR